ncbi:MAG TPA: diiron oxygenase [Gemmataceae bacterium]|jgi:hypothetical protein|nr:diiron oxygenase [Gemmataceae bacterium]
MKTAPRIAVVTKFPDWDRKATARVGPRRVLDSAVDNCEVYYFPPELVPVIRHPLVEALGPAVTRDLIIRHLYRYLDFTAHLEFEVVNSVAMKIALGKAGVVVPDVMRADAFKLYEDEAHHAQFSDDLRRQVEAATGVVANIEGDPPFLSKLRHIQASLPYELAASAEMLFTVVSETLISSTLNAIPKDQRVATAVRQVVRDHAEDEGLHHAYFTAFFDCFWPQVRQPHQEMLGALIPRFIRIFLEPDRRGLYDALRAQRLTPDQAEQAVEESYPESLLAEDARYAAQATIAMVERHGLLEDSCVRDAFVAYGLIRRSS